jgi:hypothetical protein
MRVGAQVLCVVAGLLALPVASVHAGTYAGRVRWAAGGGSGIVGYRVYFRPAGGAYGRGLDVGMPAAGTGGLLSAVVRDLDTRTDYVFAVTAVGTGGAESGRSNEVRVGYGDVAPLLDSDGDGLSDAAEDKNLNRLVDAGETDPDDPDTDGDGVGDPADRCPGTGAGQGANALGCACAQMSCDDADPCTSDSCSPGAGCVHAAVAGCGACVLGSDCRAGDPCTTAQCRDGRCVYLPVSAGTCGAAPAHTLLVSRSADRSGAVALDGEAVAGDIYVFVDPENDIGRVEFFLDANPGAAAPVQVESKAPYDLAGGTRAAANAFHTASVPAGDHLLAAVVRRADGNTEVVSAEFRIGGTCGVCDDGNPCTVDECAPAGGCRHAMVPDGAGCADGDRCNGTETCRAGTCTVGTPLACDDGDACTVDACTAQQGCTHAAVAGCQACGSAVDCDDADQCTADACSAGRCEHRALGATCRRGQGYGLMLSFSADRRDPVPLDGETVRGAMRVFVSPETGIDRVRFYVDDPERRGTPHQTENNPPFDLAGGSVTAARAFDTAVLEVGQHVITAEIRRTGGAVVVVTAAFTIERLLRACFDPTCDSALGCLAATVPDGTACDDGDPCTETETCVAGSCVAADTRRLEKHDLRFTKGRQGRRLVGRAKVPSASLLDPTTSGIVIELFDAAGVSLYRAALPGDAFSANRAGTIFRYVEGRRVRQPDSAGLKKVIVRHRGAWTTISVGIAGAHLAAAMNSERLTWAVRGGTTCASAVFLECVAGPRGGPVVCQ